MKLILSLTKVLLVLVCMSLLSSQSFASIISGNVAPVPVSGGSFIDLTGMLPVTVGNNDFQDPNLYAFDEKQNQVLGADLTVNVTTPANGGLSTIATGTSISSHYVFFDPKDSTSQIGTVLFDGLILGIITQTAELLASDLLGAIGVNYENPLLRGLENNDSAIVSLMNPSEITVDWRASTPGDYIRVITAASPVPVPAAFWLFGSALLATVGWSKKRSVTASA